MKRLISAAVLSAAVVCSSGIARAAEPLPAQSFAYDASAPLQLRIGHVQHAGTVTIEDITFASPKGGRIHGELMLPRNKTHRSGVLFVHWLGNPKTTNLSEFQRDALTVAQRGSVALAIDAMWSQKDWYEKGRAPETDLANSVKQVIDLRRSIDVLLAQPGIEAHRIAYVGHDFGAMYGAVLAGVDARVRWYVLMAGNPSFEKWYTYSAKPKDPAGFTAQMASIDPGAFLATSKAEAFLFQFADSDPYVSSGEALAFASAAPLPRGVFWYRAKHSLNVPEAFSDRIAWLDARLNPAP